MTAVLDLTALAQAHKTVSRSSFAITCGTETRNITKVHQPVYNLIQGSIITDIKLCRIIIFRFRFYITANARSGTSADL